MGMSSDSEIKLIFTDVCGLHVSADDMPIESLNGGYLSRV